MSITVRSTADGASGELIIPSSGLGFRFGADTSGQLQSGRNRFINGALSIDQRNNGLSQTITAGAALAYTVDRWYAYSVGGNVTGQRVAGVSPNQYNYVFTGGAFVTKIGFAQRIEAVNSQDLAGTTATLSVDLANSSLTTVTWTAWYANTTDTFGTLASPTRTLISSGTFTVNNALARYSTQIAIPSGATTGIEVELSVGAQPAATTWTIGRVQLEPGSIKSNFEFRDIQSELARCQRYREQGSAFFQASGVSSSTGTIVSFAVEKRGNPVINVGSVTYGNASSLTVPPSITVPFNIKTRSFPFYIIPSTSNGYVTFDWSADAEL